MRALLSRAALCLLFPLAAFAGERDTVSYVNPLIGSEKSAIGYGGTMPFVTTPFGMTDWTPQTRQNKISMTSYNYDDSTISGFIGTHQPAIWMGDYGYVTLVPQVGPLRTAPDDRKLPFRHADESAHPDYYSVSLLTGNNSSIRAEMTATERCAIFRFHFPSADVSRVLVEASRPGIAGFAAAQPDLHEISGYNPHRMDAHLGPMKLPNFKGYFVVQFRQSPSKMKTYASPGRGAYAEFPGGQTIEVRVGTSFISIEQARANLQREIPALGLRCRPPQTACHLERKAQPPTNRRRNRSRKNAPLHGPVSCAALSPDLLRIWTLLQRLRRPGAHGRKLHCFLNLGYVPRRKQPV